MAYALITGASGGIGKELARQLASRGFSLLLVARNETRLGLLAAELAETYKVAAHYYSIDLSLPEAPRQVFRWVEEGGYELRALVNNAGYGVGGAFQASSLQEQLGMMQVNMAAVVALTHLFLPRLSAAPKSYILNVASIAAYQAVPYLSTYAATKSFVLQFSRGLRYELRHSPVSVTALCPGPTDTQFAARSKLGRHALRNFERFQMAPEKVAAIAVKGMLAGKAEVITGALNKISAVLAWLSPKGLSERAGAALFKG